MSKLTQADVVPVLPKLLAQLMSELETPWSIQAELLNSLQVATESVLDGGPIPEQAWRELLHNVRQARTNLAARRETIGPPVHAALEAIAPPPPKVLPAGARVH